MQFIMQIIMQIIMQSKPEHMQNLSKLWETFVIYFFKTTSCQLLSQGL